MTEQTAQTITFRPAVVIGLGGMGTFLVTKVRELVIAQLDRQVSLGLIDQGTRNEALETRFQFLGIDSNTEEWSQELTFYRIAETRGVNEAIRLFLRQESFTRWWPKDWTNPGEFQFGCGHVRLKGRLAYFLAREAKLDISDQVSAAVGRAVRLVEQARMPAGDAPTVSVFVCTSLSGGTGGGTFLSVLQAVSRLGAAVRLYGIVVDSSIASLGVKDPKFIDIEAANNWAGLIELDAWMNSSPRLLDAVGWRPFWPYEQSVDTIEGSYPVAHLVWLFGLKNLRGHQFPSLTAAIWQAADTIATWIHSSSTATLQAMDSDVGQYVATFGAQTDAKIGRSAMYGAMGVGHVRFPSDRVLNHLSASLGIDAVQQFLLASDPGGRGAIIEDVESFMVKAKLREQPPYDEVLARFRAIKNATPARIPPSPAIGAILKRTNRIGYKSVVDAAMQTLNAENGRVSLYSQSCEAEVANSVNGRGDGSDTGLKAMLGSEVLRLLLSSPYGLGRALEFLRTLRSGIESDEAASLRSELEGDAVLAGYRVRLQDHMRALPNHVKGLRGRLPGEEGRKIESFAAGWWSQMIDITEAIVEREAGLSLYEALVDEIAVIAASLEDVSEAIRNASDKLTQTEAEALASSRAPKGGLTYEVLVHPTQARNAFPAPEGAPRQVAEAFILRETDGLRDRFDALLALRRDVRSGSQRAATMFEATRADTARAFTETLHGLASPHFADAVQARTVWEAIEAEVRDSNPKAAVNDLLRAIESRMEPVVNAAQPMMPIEDGKLLGITDPPQTSVMLVANDRAIADFAAKVGAQQNWLADGVLKRLLPKAIVTPVNTPDHQQVSVSMRAIGFPLMGLSGEYASKYLQYFVEQNGRWRIWSDQRAARLPSDFSPIVRTEVDYVTALALGWKIIAYGTRSDGTPDRAFFYYKGPMGLFRGSNRPFAKGIKELIEQLELRSDDFALLRKEVAQTFKNVARSGWLEKVGESEDFLYAELAQERPGSDRRDVLDRLAKAIKQRRSEVARLYKPDDPDTDSALDKLLPQEGGDKLR